MENKGIKLWVDDTHDPKSDEGIRKGAKGNEIWVKTTEEAKPLLMTGNVISISLDGDLGIDDDGHDISGTDITKFIQELAYYNKIPRLQWAIHSDNYWKRKYMKMDLERADEFWDKHEQEQ